jgi:hypothetical protein
MDQRRTPFASPFCTLAQKSLQTSQSVDAESDFYFMIVFDYRSWTGMGGPICLRITHLCPNSVQDLQNQRNAAVTISSNVKAKHN